jgi:hypothetical protein
MGFIGVWGVWIPWGGTDFRCRGQTLEDRVGKTEHDSLQAIRTAEHKQLAIVPNLLLPWWHIFDSKEHSADDTTEQRQKADKLKFIRYGDSEPSCASK